MAYDSIFKTLYNSEKSCKFICKQRKKHRKKMTNTKMLTVIFFFLGGSILGVFLFLSVHLYIWGVE